jgi:agarase
MVRTDESPAAVPVASSFRQVRGRPGFFRAGQDAAGLWWLIDPAGAPFFFKGVHGLRAAEGTGDGGLPEDPLARLRTWRFNAAGLGADALASEEGLPFLASVECGSTAPLVVGPGVRLPDVFDPEWPRRVAAQAARVCPARRDCRELIGWVSDDRLAWGPPAGTGRPSLLQLCLSLEPGFAAYHAAWEFVLAPHGGQLAALARSWSVTLPNKAGVRERTRAEEGIATRGYLRDEARWTREYARRYFSVTGPAIRSVDPNHLVLGCRFRGPAGPHVLAEGVHPAVDVAMPDWREIPAPAPGRPVQPVLAGDVSWVGPDFRKLPPAARVLQLTSVEWMLRRGRSAIERLARHPAVVGYAWSRWRDEPGEQAPFAPGLVHADGGEAREHTELLAYFNVRAESLRRAAAPDLP